MAQSIDTNLDNLKAILLSLVDELFTYAHSMSQERAQELVDKINKLK